jgi:hypothetical protein
MDNPQQSGNMAEQPYSWRRQFVGAKNFSPHYFSPSYFCGFFLARSIFLNWICDQPAGMQTKQSATGRHCGERSDEAIQKYTTFRIASSLRSSQ